MNSSHWGRMPTMRIDDYGKIRKLYESPIHKTMLGESYFTLVQALHDSRSFEEVANLLTTQLPLHFSDDHAIIALVGEGPTLLEILGNGSSSEVARGDFERVARQLPKHPLLGSVDFGNPGNLGFAASDYLEPGEYLKSEFNQGLPEPMQANDCLTGRLSTAWNPFASG